MEKQSLAVCTRVCPSRRNTQYRRSGGLKMQYPHPATRCQAYSWASSGGAAASRWQLCTRISSSPGRRNNKPNYGASGVRERPNPPLTATFKLFFLHYCSGIQTEAALRIVKVPTVPGTTFDNKVS